MAASAEEAPDGMPGRRTLSPEVAAEIVRAAQDADRTLERIRALGLHVVTVEDPAYPSRLAAIDLPPHLLFVDGDAERPRGRARGRGRRHTARVERGPRPGLAGRGRADRRRRERRVRAGDRDRRRGARRDPATPAAAPSPSSAAATAACTRGRTPGWPRPSPPGAARSSPSSRPTWPRPPARSRAGTGSSAASPTPRWSSRRRRASGALITASWALEQGRDCFLVPGRIDDPAHAGCLAFLREFPGSARIVAGVPQLIEDLGLATRPAGGRRPRGSPGRRCSIWAMRRPGSARSCWPDGRPWTSSSRSRDGPSRPSWRP